TLEVLEAQLERYSDILVNDIDFLSEFSTKNKSLDYAGRIILNDNEVPTFNFGKYRGKSVESVFKSDPSYYSWMMNGDFTLDTKQVITELKIKFEKSNNPQ
ncbi:MAG TPA: 3'-5' exonuclease, partial [Bacteroidales bacterium]|nr:3'-5' exonuclease [Bacteroidales bacterium]